jgi:type II secretory pathway component PulK
MKNNNESGVALIMALLLLILMGTMLHIFIVKVYSSQRMMGLDMQRQVFIVKGT